MSEIQKQRYEDNPAARQECSERTKKYFEDNPHAKQRMSETKKKQFENNPIARQECCERTKKYFEDNPDAKIATGERMKKYFENPESKRRIADIKCQNKPFDVSTTDGTFIKTFTYQFEALEYLRMEHNITSTIKISSVLRGQRSSSAGFVFKYK